MITLLKRFHREMIIAAGCLLTTSLVHANIPGGGTGAGPNVTITDGGSTVTMDNGIVSIVITKSSAEIHTINYTFDNTGSSQTLNLLAGGSSGGKLYWFQNGGTFITGPFTESVVANTGDYAEIKLFAASATNGTVEIDYSMLRGSSGFYTTAILTHRSSDGNMHIELRPNIYAGSIFNWMSVDGARNRLMEVSGGKAIGVQGAPKECTLWTNGIYAGQYEDKYKYSADLGTNRVWGWSSVGAGGKNIGIWNVSASAEYYPGGPMMRELMEHIGTTILNVFTGNYYGLATDGGLQSGETWSHVYGPYLYYCNAVTNTLTGTNAPAQALYHDALAQGAAEETAWPYSWFSNTNYVPASGRGTVTGKIVIADSGNPNASAANLWIGLVQQPSTAWDSVYDFQQWMKPYQFWTRTDASGNFSIPHVIAGANYTLYAFGPGAAGTFMSQNQSGGNPPLLYDVPASQFAVTVTGGATNNLGIKTWTPARVGATVFQIGYPNRTADKFRHGDDYWVGDIGPSKTVPSPVWSKWLEYPFDFPNGVNYVVGQSRWSTDWNFVQPVVTDSQGNYNNSSSTITFNLATAPTNGATASLYLGLSSDYYAAIIVTVNGNNLGSVGGVTGMPNNSIPTTGYYVGYGGSDTTIREGNNGAFTDERINFPASLLHTNAPNTITIGIRQVGSSYFADHAMYDYIRLELTGYVPPPPASVTAYAGNNGNLITWPVVPGATSYKVLRSTTSGSGYSLMTNGVVGPVCGSGLNNATWLDTTAVNGTPYYYVVQSVNPDGSSANSPESSGTAPSGSVSSSAPAAPTGLSVASVGHHQVTLNWTASVGADFYTVYRSTLFNNGGGGSNVLSTIVLANNVTNTTYTDNSPTDGSTYRYVVTATSAGGSSGDSAPATGVPLPTTPATAPASLIASFIYGSSTNITLSWNAVAGAVGYVISRATSAGGPYTYLQTVTETTYTDYNLNPAVIYYYRVAAMNAGGVSGNNTDLVNSQQDFPASLAASATNGQVTLIWSAATNATSYTVKRGTSPGGETFTVVSGYTGTNYTNTGLANGTTYYYVVTATGPGGVSGNSPEASATPLITGDGIWLSPADGNWSSTANWIGGAIASGDGHTADFSSLSLSSNVTVTLDSDRTISDLIFGDKTDAYGWTLAGSNTLTLGSAPNIEVINQSATINTPLAGSNGLSKTGAGTLTLTASNAITGDATLTSGSLALDFSAAGSPAADILPAANRLALGGGSLHVIGNSAGSSQTFNSTTLPSATSGQSGVSAAPVSGTIPAVNLGTLTGQAGPLVRIDGPAYNSGASSGTTLGGNTVAATATINATANTLNGGLIAYNTSGNDAGAYATVGLYDWAAMSTGAKSGAESGSIVGASQIPGFYTVLNGSLPSGSYGLNVDLTASGTMDNNSGSSSASYSTVRFNANSAVTLSTGRAVGGNSVGALLVTPNVGAHNTSFAGSVAFQASRDSSGGATGLTVWQNNVLGELVISAVHQNSKNWADSYSQGGPGTVLLSGVNTYTGENYLNNGFTVISADSGLGDAATGAAVNLSGGTVVGDGTFALDNGGANSRAVNLGSTGGGLTATADNTFTVDGLVGSATGAGPLTIGIAASSANNGTAGLLPGTGAGTANSTPVFATGTVVLNNANYYTGGTILQSGTLNINGIFALGGGNYGGLTFNGGTLQYAANFPGSNGSADLTSIGTAGVTLAAGGGTIDLNGNAVTYAGSIGNGGSGALTVESSAANGSLTLQGANTYQGGTTVTNATLWISNAGGSATGSGNVTVQNGGALAGNGAVAGSVTVAAGGSFVPGDLTGGLSIGNDLTLAAGSTTTVQVQHSPLASSGASVTGNLAEGGTLVVTNAGGSLAEGDTFTLFSAGSYSGAFDHVVLPPLTGNLVWNTNMLQTAGTISVVTLTSPVISSVQINGGNLVIAGNGGVSGWPFYVLSSTNLATGPWTPVATNQFDSAGNFTVTNTVSSGAPQMFFRLQLQ